MVAKYFSLSFLLNSHFNGCLFRVRIFLGVSFTQQLSIVLKVLNLPRGLWNRGCGGQNRVSLQVGDQTTCSAVRRSNSTELKNKSYKKAKGQFEREQIH